MKPRGKIVQCGLAAAAVGMVLMPVPARADVAKCQHQLEIQSQKLFDKIYDGLQVCKDVMRREVQKGILKGAVTGDTSILDCEGSTSGCAAHAAAACEKKLQAIYGIGLGTLHYAVKDFRRQIENLREGHACFTGLLSTDLVGRGQRCHAHSQCNPPSGVLPWASPSGAVGMAQCTRNGFAVIAATGLEVPMACCTGKGVGTCKIAQCSATCTDEDLPAALAQDGGTLGHIVSGAGQDLKDPWTTPGPFGPPANRLHCDEDNNPNGNQDPNCASKWLIDFLLFATEKFAIKEQLMVVPDTLALFQKMVTATNSPPVAGVSSKKATVCSPVGVNPATQQYRPNLCHFGVECRDVSCQLDTRGVCPGGACDPDFAGCCAANPSACCDTGDPSPAVCGGGTCLPASSGSFMQVKSVEFDNVKAPLLGALNLEVCKAGRAIGNCKGNGSVCLADSDCGANGPCNLTPGQGLGFQFGVEPNFLYLINQPSRTLRVKVPPALTGSIAAACVQVTRSEGWCDCAGSGSGLKKDFALCQDHISLGKGDPQNTVDTCDRALNPNNLDPTYPGTITGTPTYTASGSSVAGDCVDLVSLQFTLIPDASDFGADGIPCTEDDLGAPTPPFSVPLTTGTSTADLQHAVSAPGVCVGGPYPGSSCVQDINCGECDPVLSGFPCATGTAPVDCWALHSLSCARPGSCSAPTLVTLPLTLSGAKTNCANYAAGNLSGLGLSGAIVTTAGPVGDTAIGFRLDCK